VPNVSLLLRSGPEVTGLLRFDESGHPPVEGLGRCRLMFLPTDNFQNVPVLSIGTTGLFHLSSIVPGRYLPTLLPAPAGWSLRSIQVNQQEMLGLPLDVDTSGLRDMVITLTKRPATVEGVVRDKGGNPRPDSVVFVFPENTTMRHYFGPMLPSRVQRLAANTDGSFRLSNLLPGLTYYATAYLDGVGEDWSVPASLALMANSSSRFTVEDGESRWLDLLATRR
jgi:hypothetical protein